MAPQEDRLEVLLKALVALSVDARERELSGNEGAKKVEVVLATVGLNAVEIADLTGKKHDAVRKTLQRAREVGEG